MRLMPDRYADPKPKRIKGQVSQVAHISAPLKGLNLSSKLTTGDPLTAPVLTNFVVEDDRIICRAGTTKVATMPGGRPIETLIPYYGGGGQKLVAATNGQLINAQTAAVLKSGFTGNDWSWSAFSNLGDQDYTVACNGFDGVWSWDGSDTTLDPPAVVATKLTNHNPAQMTVLAVDIGKFRNGMSVVVAGAVGTGMTAANGAHVIGGVNYITNTFNLVGVDTSTGAAPQTTGLTVDPPAANGWQKEAVAAPATALWINPDQFHIVLAHQNRLFFADPANLALYYLPLQTKSGTLEGYLPLDVIFKRGGTIRSVYSWTLEGGISMNDQLVIFTSNGECAIYSGTDVASDFQLVGVFRFDAPMSKHSVINYGGELYVLISTGLVPMSTMLRAESEQLGQSDKAVISEFLPEATAHRDVAGWSVILNPNSNRAICNLPQGSDNKYTQMVRSMPQPVWSQWQDIPSRSWGWISPNLYFGDDNGNVYAMHPRYFSDNGNPIIVDVQPAWSSFKHPGLKHFKMVRTYTVSDARLQPKVDIKVDYDSSPPQNMPDVTAATQGATWDIADWDTSDWARGPQPQSQWNGVGRLGRVGAPRYTARILNAEFSITGWDVIYEGGAVL